MSLPEISRDRLSFETMLGWFGRFTPQFKLRLLMLSRQLPLAEFDERMREIFKLYRVYTAALSSVPTGAYRAREAHRLMDEELAQIDRSKIRCERGCNSCCRLFPKQITSDEAEVLADAILTGEVTVDRERLRKQAAELSAGEELKRKAAQQGCIFLGTDGDCMAYSRRPSVCRKYHVTSEPEECEKPEGRAQPQMELVPEMIVSALMSQPDARVGFLPVLLQESLDSQVPRSGS